jgi:hypothetical protein
MVPDPTDPDPTDPDPTDPDPTDPDPTDPDPTDPDPDPTGPEPDRPDFKPCSANPRPWTPSNKYRFEDERASTRKKLTPPD